MLNLDINKQIINNKLDASDNNKLDASDNNKLDASDNNKLDASDNNKLDASDNNKLDASDNSKLDASDNSKLEDIDNNKLDASDNNKLEGIDNSKILINKKILDNNNIFFKELLTNQLKNINSTFKLKYNDIKRISKYLTSSIFDPNNCSLWDGYITNEKNKSKGTYINFYFNKKKIALHRLLYINYINNINEDDYIKFSCINKGKCCNIHHMQKYTYIKNNKNENENKLNDNNVHINTNKNNLTLEF